MIATRGFLTAVECTKSVFGRGSAPDPAGGAHDAPLDPLVGWGGDTPSPFPTPLDAFGVSSLAPLAPRSQNPLRNFFSGYGTVYMYIQTLKTLTFVITDVTNNICRTKSWAHTQNGEALKTFICFISSFNEGVQSVKMGSCDLDL